MLDVELFAGDIPTRPLHHLPCYRPFSLSMGTPPSYWACVLEIKIDTRCILCADCISEAKPPSILTCLCSLLWENWSRRNSKHISCTIAKLQMWNSCCQSNLDIFWIVFYFLIFLTPIFLYSLELFTDLRHSITVSEIQLGEYWMIWLCFLSFSGHWKDIFFTFVLNKK